MWVKKQQSRHVSIDLSSTTARRPTKHDITAQQRKLRTETQFTEAEQMKAAETCTGITVQHY